MKKSTNPLWGGRFKTENSDLLKKINNSISFDFKLANEDIRLNKVYADSLCNGKIITTNENKKIQKALDEILVDIKKKNFKFSELYEDIHMNIEMLLKKKIGNLSGKIHTGKSRNDQVATDLKLWIKEKIKIIIKQIKINQITIIKKAEKNIDIIMPGFTHSQNAQPILFSHYLMAFFEMLERDKMRLKQMESNLNECPLGSGALAGNNFSQIDRKLLAKKLGFSKPTENSLDSVSDRDFVIEFHSNISILATHLSRIAEDFIIWSSSSYDFLKFPETLSTGSSIMPQKKNPDSAELIRSKTGRIFSSLLNLLIIQKGLPTGYSKDLQEDKEPTFDSYESIIIMLKVINEMIKSVKLNAVKMYESSKLGYTTATDLADWMVSKIGLSFRDAHEKTGKIVIIAENEKKFLHELPIEKFQSIEPKINKSVFEILSPENSISKKNSYGGTSTYQVKKAILRAKNKTRN